MGIDITGFNARTDFLFCFCGHTASIGIGDGGNEIGMGNVRALMTAGGLPGDDTLCATGTTDLVIASCSNWGAYGLTAMGGRTAPRRGGALSGRSARLHPPEIGGSAGAHMTPACDKPVDDKGKQSSG